MVSQRSVTLFVHILGAVALFTAMGMVQAVGTRIRTASDIHELRLWLGLMKSTGVLWPASFGTILLSGLYLAGTGWSFATPWIVTAIGSVVVMGAVGGGMVGRSFASLGQRAGRSSQLDGELIARVNQPGLWAATTALNGMAIGVLWLMVNKPGWGESLIVVVLLGLLGAGAGARLARRSGVPQRVVLE